jgi:hypothetical protein
MTIKFYVGAMRSDYATIHGLTEEVHFLTELDCVLTADNEKEAEFIHDLLDRSNKEYIRSDNEIRTYVALDIFNKLNEEV